jgi:L-amino acid N-acyltransferase YncA
VQSPQVRGAARADAAAIAAIYTQGIEDRVATFETEPRGEAQIARLLSDRDGTHPTVVAVRSDEVIGFAWVAPYSDRPCYAGIGEFSVYVARAHRGSGAGRLLVEALAQACTAHGFWKLVSKIFPENAASRALCRATGFREVGLHQRHAQLDGRWRDVIVVERLLTTAAGR